MINISANAPAAIRGYCRIKNRPHKHKLNFKIMTDVSKNSELQQSFITAVMPRFFVDERNGCIAIRDRQHPYFDIDHQGLDADLPDVVDFKMGEQIKFSNFTTWDLSPEIISDFNSRCASLNEA